MGTCIHEWLSLCRVRGHSPSGLKLTEATSVYPVGHKQGFQRVLLPTHIRM